MSTRCKLPNSLQAWEDISTAPHNQRLDFHLHHHWDLLAQILHHPINLASNSETASVYFHTQRYTRYNHTNHNRTSACFSSILLYLNYTCASIIALRCDMILSVLSTLNHVTPPHFHRAWQRVCCHGQYPQHACYSQTDHALTSVTVDHQHAAYTVRLISTLFDNALVAAVNILNVLATRDLITCKLMSRLITNLLRTLLVSFPYLSTSTITSALDIFSDPNGINSQNK